MAKQSGRLAPTAQSEKGGSPLTGLFAEENEFDRRALWRIGSWGAAAVGAVTLAVVSNQWSLGLRREQLAAADLTRQSQQIQSLTKESQTETRRLASAIETLNNDRDRLFSRVTVIEQGLDSVTGALAKQATPDAAPSAAPRASAAPQASAAGPSQASQQSALAAQAPVPAAVATTAVNPAVPDKPRADAGKSTTSSAANAGPASTATISPPQMSAAAGASLMARSMMSPPDPAAPKLIEVAKPADPVLSDAKPVGSQATDTRTSDAKATDGKAADATTAEAKMAGKTDGKTEEKANAREPEAASTATSETVASANAMDGSETEAASVAAKRTDFAVELGSANSVGGLRALWRGLRHLNGELGALNPIIVIKEARTGLGMQLHLAAGPLKDAAAAAKICAVLAEARRPCETTVYDGQRLAMKADAAPPASRPASEANSPTRPDARPDPRAEGKTEARPEGKLDGRPASSKRGWSRHSRKEEPPAPPPPAPAPAPEPPSTLSTLFGRK